MAAWDEIDCLLLSVLCKQHVMTTNVSQAGAWDVDDTGLEYMPSQDLAERIQQVHAQLDLPFCFWPCLVLMCIKHTAAAFGKVPGMSILLLHQLHAF